MIIIANVKAISDLRNYTEVSNENPVYLTKNASGKYAIVKLQELDKLKGTVRLVIKFEEGEKSGREKGWLSVDDVEAVLGL